MRAFTGLSFALSFALSVAPAAVSADSHAFVARSHGRRHPGVSRVEARGLEKRFDNARFTYYADGLGACGKTNQPSDFIVALNSAQYDGGSHCFDMITITANGKTTQAQIMDECPGCPFGGLDFSEGLFKFFADESAGVLTGSWSFGSGAAPPPPPPSPSPSPKPKPTTSSPPPPPPPPKTTEHTSTPPPPPPPTSTEPSTTSSSTSTEPTTTSTPPPTTSKAAPTSTPPPTTTSSAAPTSSAPPVVNDPDLVTAGLVVNAGQSSFMQSNLAVVQLGRIVELSLGI